MNILYYTEADLDGEVAARVHVSSTCRELARLGHRVTLLVKRPQQPIAGDFRVVTVPHFGRGGVWDRVSRWLWRLWALIAVAWLRPEVIYDRYGPGTRMSALLGRLWRALLVVELNGWQPNDQRHMSDDPVAIEQALESLVTHLESAAVVIASSPGVRQLAIQQASLPAERVHYIPNGVDVEAFSPGSVPVRTAREYVIGYVGSLHPEQDIQTLLLAVARLATTDTPVELRLVGGGPSLNHWQQQAGLLGIQDRVRFLGERQHATLPEFLWGVDVAVAVYSRRHVRQCDGVEAAMKLWEYWASRRPVVATDFPGTQSYVHHERRRYWAVEPEDASQLALALHDLYQRPDLRRELADNGYAYVVQHRSWRKTAAEISAILQHCSKQDMDMQA